MYVGTQVEMVKVESDAGGAAGPVLTGGGTEVAGPEVTGGGRVTTEDLPVLTGGGRVATELGGQIEVEV